MNLVNEVRKRNEAGGKTVVFPECEDRRVLQAASFLISENISSVILVGEEEKITRRAQDYSIALDDSVVYSNFQYFDDKERLAEDYYHRNKHKEISREQAYDTLQNPLFFGASLVANGFADGCVAGSIATTADVIRAAIKCIGLRQGSSIVSSIFLMVLPDGKVLTYADCGVVPYPDREQLADIAVESARTQQLLTGEEPIVAMLSFSTKGSARHERTELVQDALSIAREKMPKLKIDGEFQFDAAFVPEVAKLKAPGSEVAGHANVMIFPNLDAGNIGYKITERLAGAKATGPILQGLAKPMMDLSRGCSWEDIVQAACAAILMGEDRQ